MKPVSFIFNLFTFFYPLILMLSYKLVGSRLTAIWLIVFFVLRLFFIEAEKRKMAGLFSGCGILLASIALLMNNTHSLLYYPVFVSLFFFVYFTSSFFREETVVEKIAAKTDKDFDERARPYCRRVTFLWSCFFVANGSIAFWTTLAGELNDLWIFYNGFLSYCLIGCLMGGEYAYRVLVVKKRHLHE